MLAQPMQGVGFDLLGDMSDLDVAISSFDRVEEPDRSSVPQLATQRGPGLPTDMVRGDDTSTSEVFEESQGCFVVLIAIVGAGDEERGVGEDQGSGFDGP